MREGNNIESESRSEDKTGGCNLDSALGVINVDPDEWLEETVWYGMRMWHVIFLSIGVVLSFTILLCCCFKFRIPRTKQEIEGDYIRRRIMRKFRKRLKAIQNQELDEMDLKKALDKIRTELKSDTESLQQSDVLSGATLSSVGMGNPGASTYRRASQIQIDISLEDLRIQSLGLGARIALAFNRFFGRPKKSPLSTTEEEAGIGDASPETGDKLTTALIPKQTGKLDKKEEPVDLSKKKAKDDKKPDPAATTSTQAKDKTNNEKKKEEKKKDSDKPKGAKKEESPPAKITTEVETKKPGKKDDKNKKKEATLPKKDDNGKSDTKKDKGKPDEDKAKEKNKPEKKENKKS